MRSKLACLVFVGGVLCCQPLFGERVYSLDDFDGAEKLSKTWTAMGEISVRRVAVKPFEGDERQAIVGVEGMLAKCDAKPKSKLLVNRTFKRPSYEDYDTIRFRLRAENASEEKPLAFEFQFFSEARPASLWRKFTVDSDRWQTIELPMQHFRYSNGAVVDWAEVRRYGVHFRDISKVSLEAFELVAKEGDANPYFTPIEVGEFAFADKLLSSENEHFVLMTDDRRVDRKKTLVELEKLYKMLFADFPELTRPARRVPVLIFSEKDAYQQFWSNLGGLYVSQVPPVRSSGYSLLGVAGTYYSEEYGPVRPVLIHEACHALLARPLGLSNGSEWLHEGLANCYQLSWTKQNIDELNRKRIDAGRHRPLSDLLSGQRIAISDYAQATLFTKFLLDNDERKSQLFAAMQEMRKRNSTKLEPICEKHFGKSLDDLELEWIRWARSRWN